MYMEISIRYSTIATKEAAGIGYNDFFFHMRARVKAEVYSTLDITGFFFRMSTQVKAEVRSFNIQYGQLLLWTSLPNFPITTLVKLLSSYIERTPKTSACISGL